MPCSACGCLCADCGVPRDDTLAAPLLDHEKGRRPISRTTGTPSSGSDELAADKVVSVMEMIGHKAIMIIYKMIFRGLFLLLGMFLFDSMKRYAVNYIGGNTWFSTFVVIVVAVPVVEAFCILSQMLNESMSEMLPG